mmetsp:Transcript_114762/g.357425  ORF Transcript_114762/g.357425 Transcript_114762/m.357425 type:complete len:229 (+) Transcript_114762:368-1054(+)
MGKPSMSASSAESKAFSQHSATSKLRPEMRVLRAFSKLVSFITMACNTSSGVSVLPWRSTFGRGGKLPTSDEEVELLSSSDWAGTNCSSSRPRNPNGRCRNCCGGGWSGWSGCCVCCSCCCRLCCCSSSCPRSAILASASRLLSFIWVILSATKSREMMLQIAQTVATPAVANCLWCLSRTYLQRIKTRVRMIVQLMDMARKVSASSPSLSQRLPTRSRVTVLERPWS